MAHEFLKPELIMSTALGLAERQVILPALMWRDAESHFSGRVGPRGDKLIIPMTGVTNEARELNWRDKSRKIITDDIKERSVEIKLDTYLYKAFQFLREEQTLDIADFGAQVLAPMITSIIEGAEDRIADHIKGETFSETIEVQNKERGFYEAMIDARKFLNSNRVPRQGRIAILGSEMEARALKDPSIVDADRSGSDSALRDAQIGRIAGINMIGSDVIDPEAMYLFHPTAFPTVFRAPKPASSVARSASESAAGISMSYWESLDSDNDSDRAFLGTFFGINTLKDPKDPKKPEGTQHLARAVKIVPAAPSGDPEPEPEV